MLDFKLTQVQQEAQQLMATKRQHDKVYDVTIIGGGPAGLTAAIYAGRAGLKTVVLTGPMRGGQVSTTDQVENFPGFPQSIEGAELALRFQSQAERFGAQIVSDSVTEVDFSTSPLAIQTGSQTYQGRTVRRHFSAVASPPVPPVTVSSTRTNASWWLGEATAP
jgi:alkyl hydroperoxide reductase subunit AhpF